MLRLGEETGQLPPFVKRQVAHVRGSTMAPALSQTFDPVAGFTRVQYEGDAIPRLHSDSLYEPRPSETVIVESIPSAPESSVVLSRQTAIVTADGFTVGHLHALALDERLRVVEVVLTAGHLYKHHVRVPSSVVAELTADRILLTQGLDEATDAVDEADVEPA
jgi:hypothetical protein